MSIHQKMMIFFEKIVKAYFKAVILTIKTYENILKFTLLMGCIGHIDCFGKFFKAIIYRCKKR